MFDETSAGGERASALVFADETVALGTDDAVVVAVPHAVAPNLLPGIMAPDDARAIVNAHFRLDRAAVLPGGLRCSAWSAAPHNG